MKKMKIDVILTDEEYDMLKWLAKSDNVSVKKEMAMLFGLQLNEEMVLYYEESLLEERGCNN